jgi:peptide/nickel transport system substrate-binding protein
VQRYVLLTTLLQRDSSLAIRPYLARHWEWAADSTRLILHLAQDVRWHDGAPTTARDAAWTIEAARDAATGYPRVTDLADVASVAASDDSTLILTFGHRQSALLDVLTDLAILPAHLLDTIPHERLRSAAWNQAPVGNGPFRFVSHQPNRRWVFAADPGFSPTLGGPPHIDRLVIAVVDEPTTKLAALTSGELDFAGISPAHVAFVRHDPRLAVVRYPLLFTYAIVLNTRHPPFDDIRVRQAINFAIDRTAIVDGYLFGLATTATGPLLTDTTAGSLVDLPQARALLSGRAVHFELLTVGSGEAALEQMIQTQLAAVGITVTIRQLELSTYLDRVQGANHDFQAAVMGVAGDLNQGELAPLLLTAGELPPNGADAQLRTFADSLPAVFLYHAGGVQGMNRRVSGVHMDLRGELATLHDWRVTP